MAVPADYRELHQAFSRGPAVLRKAIDDLSMADLTRRSDGGAGWSTRDILVHLADMEIVRAFRIRLILAADNPAIVPVDEPTWQRRLQYLWRSPEAALSQFEIVRFGTAEILTHCGRDAWERTGNHLEEGPVSVADIVRRGVAHDEEHAAQIAAVRAS